MIAEFKGDKVSIRARSRASDTLGTAIDGISSGFNPRSLASERHLLAIGAEFLTVFQSALARERATAFA